MTDVRDAARAWIADDPDPAARAELQPLVDDPSDAATAELADRFAGDLVFGTAGLRGPLRAGPNGMNLAVVRRTAAGLAAYLADQQLHGAVVIGYDARHGSARFAQETARVVAGAGCAAKLLPRPLPTPVLAFSVRQLGAAAGVMVTASHNPRQDNGYKVYLGDGAQIVPPADGQIQAAIGAVGPLAAVPLADTWQRLDDDPLETYLTLVSDRLSPESPRAVRVAYTPLHGVGGAVLTAAFELAGFPAPTVVAEQAAPDPDFPTVAFPNPEEPGAMDLVLALAERTGADVAIATDPDADRCAVAVGGRVLRGDELGVLLADHLLRRGGARGTFATTIVSSSLLGALCRKHGVPYAETRTGFKWIVRAADDLSYGYEEALGYAVAPDLVRDKDGISAALLVAELVATLATDGRTLVDRLDELACEHGVYATDQVSVRVTDVRQIAEAMARLRAKPPAELLGIKVTVEDLLPDADVVRLRGAGGLRVVVRPSGTEPTLKAYLEVVQPVTDDVNAARCAAGERLAALRTQVAAALDT